MNNHIKIYINFLSSFDKELNNIILKGFVEKLSTFTLKRGDVYIEENKTPTEIGFITSGLIRSYLINENGDEKTINFFTEGNYTGDFESMIYQTPTQYCFRCLEPTTLVQITYENFKESIKAIPTLEKHSRILAEQKLHSQNKRLKQFLTQTAEQRYLHFIEHHAALFNRVSLSHLSSYLGIERQSLTRIRQKLKAK